MKAIVTGGAGFIGSHIVDSLVSDGHEVIAIDNLSAGKLHNLYPRHDNSKNLSFAMINIISPEIAHYMEDVDIIFHNAASKKNICLKDPHQDLVVNAGGTLNLLQLAVKYGVKKFVHASTGSVYGEAVVIPQTENHPLNPCSFYGISKLAGEKYVKMYSDMGWLDTTILRYFHVYGPRQEDGEFGGVVAIFIKNSKNNLPLIIYGHGNQERSFTHVDDIVLANRLVAENDTNGQVYNCASGIKVTVKELAEKIITMTGSQSKIKYEDWLIGDIVKFYIDNRKICELGLEFETNINAGLGKTIDEVSFSYQEI